MELAGRVLGGTGKIEPPRFLRLFILPNPAAAPRPACRARRAARARHIARVGGPGRGSQVRNQTGVGNALASRPSVRLDPLRGGFLLPPAGCGRGPGGAMLLYITKLDRLLVRRKFRISSKTRRSIRRMIRSFWAGESASSNCSNTACTADLYCW
jgi:hypothetical protein